MEKRHTKNDNLIKLYLPTKLDRLYLRTSMIFTQSLVLYIDVFVDQAKTYALVYMYLSFCFVENKAVYVYKSKKTHKD